MIWSGVIVMGTTLLLYMLFWQVLLYLLKSNPDLNIKRAMLLYATWIAFICALGQTQFLADFSAVPPRLLIFWLIIFASAILFVRSKTGHMVAMQTPLWILVGFHCFRVLAEWTLYAGYQEGIFPVQMTFEGMNYDIISGLFALVSIPILYRCPNQKSIAWAFNIVGIALLITITVVATLSAQTPLRYFMNDPPNTAVAYMPHILLPGVLVHAAYTGHFLLTIRLLRSPTS